MKFIINSWISFTHVFCIHFIHIQKSALFFLSTAVCVYVDACVLFHSLSSLHNRWIWDLSYLIRKRRVLYGFRHCGRIYFHIGVFLNIIFKLPLYCFQSSFHPLFLSVCSLSSDSYVLYLYSCSVVKLKT